jgi:hypothetical protein
LQVCRQDEAGPLARQLAVVPVYLGLAGLNVLVDWLLVRQGLGILGVALGTLSVNVLWAVAHTLLVRRVTGDRSMRTLLQPVAVIAAGGLPASVALAVAGVPFGLPAVPVVASAAIIGSMGWIGLVWLTRTWVAELREDRLRKSA